jgi:protein-S-isoprenylcysteine O-methyltransferase Ste14
MYPFAVLQIVGAAVLLCFVIFWRGPWDFERELGTALVIIGLAGIGTARYQLGKSFSITAQARQLVTRGIYSKIRNPIYVFGSILFAGFILILHRPVLWVLFAAMVIVQILRARREAQVLEAAFGDAYREFRRKTWF